MRFVNILYLFTIHSFKLFRTLVLFEVYLSYNEIIDILKFQLSTMKQRRIMFIFDPLKAGKNKFFNIVIAFWKEKSSKYNHTWFTLKIALFKAYVIKS